MGDIHGACVPFTKLSKEPCNPTRYFNLGDYVDGWSQSPQVLDYLIDLSTTNSCVFIKSRRALLHWLTEVG
jgi:serine/threonine protein phosphatase 1